MAHLFQTTQFAVGLKPGEHVVHIINQEDLTGYSVLQRDDQKISDQELMGDGMKLNPGEVYSSESDRNTAAFFIDTAREMNTLYDRYPKDSAFRKVLESISTVTG